MARGGARPGAGRKPGSPNAGRAGDAYRAGAEAFPGWSPLVLFAQLANDDGQPVEVRLDAAKAAARYMIPVPKPVETVPETIIEIEERVARIRSDARTDRGFGLDNLAERLQRAAARINVNTGVPRAMDDPIGD
jgi:hypothetical protein